MVCVDPDTDGGVVVSAGPGGSILNSSKVTFNATSMAGPLVNSTAQASMTFDPKGGTINWLGLLVDSVMEVGAGTAMAMIIIIILILQLSFVCVCS